MSHFSGDNNISKLFPGKNNEIPDQFDIDNVDHVLWKWKINYSFIHSFIKHTVSQRTLDCGPGLGGLNQVYVLTCIKW